MNQPLNFRPHPAKGRFYAFLSLLIILLCPALSKGQNGTGMWDAIPAGAYSSCGGSSFSDYRNNYYYNGTYYYDNYNGSNYNQMLGQSSPDVWYAFTVTGSTDLSISLCGSSYDTYVHLLDGNGNYWDSNDDSDCGLSSRLDVSLTTGTYYVVVEGYSSNTGDYSLNISSSPGGTPSAGANLYNAINAGTFSSSGNYSHSLWNGDPCLGNDYGRNSIDIFYKFTLNSTATVKLSHCGSAFDTYMWLLNSSGGLITYNDDNGAGTPCPGTQSYIETTLAAGTYYVVSEGYGESPGTIVTNINVTMTAPFTVSYPAIPASFSTGTPVSIVPTVSNAPAFNTQITSTFAGSTVSGYADGMGTAARFDWPLDAAIDGSGNIYVADSRNQRIRKISPSGVVSTLAGNGSQGWTDGAGTSASFRNPAALAIDASGNVYVCDQQNHKIRKITPAGVVSTFAGSGSAGFANGTGTAAMFNGPAGLCIDASGNLYVGDAGNQRIRKITPAGVVSTYAGTGVAGLTNGAAASATFKDPRGLVIDGLGNLIVCDRQNYVLRKITPAGIVSTLAGSGVTGYLDGPAGSARLGSPNSVTIDEGGNIYIGDQNGNHMIRKLSPSGTVSTLAGSTASGSTDGTGSAVRFNNIYGVCAAPGGVLYVADTYNNAIRKVITAPFTISPQLPQGLVFNTTNGSISGTPLVASPATSYTVSAYGQVVATLTIGVSGGTPVAPSQDQNYIITYSPRVENLTTTSAVVAASGNPNQVQTTIQYFDGLGRPLQTVQVKGSGDASKDVVIPNEYDAYGREAKKYLPYASGSNNGSYKTTALTDVISYYQAGAQGQYSAFNTPYAQTVFEASPLNRVLEQGAPGNAWQPVAGSIAGHTVKMEYGSNAANEVRIYEAVPVSTTGEEYKRTLQLSSQHNGYYAANELYKTITKDENWTVGMGKAGTIEEYKDKEGRVVLKRTFNRKADQSLETLSTYYVYDHFGNLSYVLPPKAEGDNGNISQTTLNELCYQYYYDHRNRLIEKKIPGKGWEYTVYNKLDQVVATQDALQQASQRWLFTKYDALGRVIMSGFYSRNIDRASLQAEVDSHVSPQNPQNRFWEEKLSGVSEYSNNSYPQNNTTLLTVNYYGTYEIPGKTTGFDPGPGISPTTRITGLLTGTKVSRTDGSSPMLTINYYNEDGRVIESISENHIGGKDRVANVYNNITGELLSSTRQHSSSYDQAVVSNQFSYDHMGRKKWVKQNINNNSPVIIAWHEYSETGQLLTKRVGNTNATDYEGSSFTAGNFLQSTSFSYNERGWLKESRSGLFDMLLKYQDGTNPQYNGNISGQSWGTLNNRNKNYAYTYDALNRLKEGISDQNYSEIISSYDKNGNIESLSRTGRENGTQVYSYTGNWLESISGIRSGSFARDVNGNQTYDGTRGINITYNYLNLPENISGSKTISYTYDATGRKLKKVSSISGTTDYVNGIHYKNISNTYQIEFIQTEEGRAMKQGSNSSGTATYTYEYTLSDHLGNNRVTFQRNPVTQNLEQVESTDYYPFGMATVNPESKQNKYLYNGKELQEELSTYDYGWRQYDPVIARWNVIDPLAEVHDDLTPYNYVMNNPLIYIDEFGLDTTKVIQLKDVVVNGYKSAPKLEPFTGFWGWMDFHTGGGEKNGVRYNMDGQPVGWGYMTGTAPDIGLKSGVNTVYKGVKAGLPYIGKSFNVLKRYTKAERLLLKIEPVLGDIKDAKLLRAIEQKVLEYKKTMGEVANKINAYSPDKKDYAQYMQKAEQWLQNNAPNWKDLFD